MIPQDELGAWADERYDAPRTTEWSRCTRIIDNIATVIAFLAYEATLVWVGISDGSEGATQAAGMSAPQSDMLMLGILGLMGFLLVCWATVAFARALRR